MYERRDYKALRTFATLTAGFGWAVVAFMFVAGFLLGREAQGSLSGLVLGVVGAATFGLGFIVWGQMVSVFLDQKEILEEIHRTLSQGTRSGPPEGSSR